MANRILELALNRTGKSVDSKTAQQNNVESSESSIVRVTQSPETVVKHISNTRDNIEMMNGILMVNQAEGTAKKLSPAEIERTKNLLQKDISQYNSDIKLLSLLLGRPVNSQDISKLAATNLGKTNIRSVPTLTLPSTTAFTTERTTVKTTRASLSRSTPEFKPLTEKETKFLEALEEIQTTKAPTTTTTRSVSKSQEALIAALLRQQGFGPNNQVPIEVSLMINPKTRTYSTSFWLQQKILQQLPLNNINQQLPVSTSTYRPFSPLPPVRRQPRPLLDGRYWNSF